MVTRRRTHGGGVAGSDPVWALTTVLGLASWVSNRIRKTDVICVTRSCTLQIPRQQKAVFRGVISDLLLPRFDISLVVLCCTDSHGYGEFS